MQPVKSPLFPLLTDSLAQQWAGDVLQTMSLDEKIGQLIHIASWSDRGEEHREYVLRMIRDYHIGGIIFFQGDPLTQAVRTNEYQAASIIPLMVSMDAEWGLGMRLEGAEPFPYQMTLGAVQDIDLIKKMAGAIGRQLRRIGCTLNHAPVIDVNTNPDNPVINFRSFGQRKEAVAQRGIAYMQGLQEERVLACGKHFPGHGDTSADSHKQLPLLTQSKEALVATELYPFRELFDAGLGAVMIAHLQIPALEPDENRASTLSSRIVTGLLKEEMKFEGLVITDALDMKAVADHYPPGLADVEALLAGNEVLLFVRDVAVAIDEIRKAVTDGRLSESEIDERCYKQLMYKYWMGLHEFQSIDLTDLPEAVNVETRSINEELFRASVTLLSKNQNFPVPGVNRRVLILSVYADGDKPDTGALYHHTLLKGAIGNKTSDVPHFAKELMAAFPVEDRDYLTLKYHEIREKGVQMLHQVSKYDHVILAVHDIRLKAPDRFGITSDMITFLGEVFIRKNAHLVFFGNPYALARLESLHEAASVILTYQENKYTHKCAAQVITGHLIPKGKLPVAIDAEWQPGYGL